MAYAMDSSSPKRQLSTSLAQQSSNQNAVTRQAQQFAQQPNFQPTFPRNMDYGNVTFRENNAPVGDGGESGLNQPGLVSESEYNAQTQAGMAPPTTPSYSNQGLPPMVAQFPVPQAAGAPASSGTTQAGGSGSSAGDLAYQIVQQMYGLARPDSQGAKEKAKEGLLSQEQQIIEQLKQSAASRGLSGGWLGEKVAEIMSQRGPNLTSAYRDIDLQDDNTYFARLLETLGGAQGLAGLDLDKQELGLRGELGRGQLDIARGGLGIQGEDLALRRAIAERDANMDFWRIIAPFLG